MVAVARTVGGLEELDDKIKAAGGSATLVPLDMKDTDGIARLALALNERYGRLDVLVGNAGILTTPPPIGHIETKQWERGIGGQRHRQLAPHPHLRCAAQSVRRRARGVSHLGFVWHGARPYFGAYAASKAALDALVRTYAAECATTKVRVNLFSPGQTRTRMMSVAFPGIDPETLPTPEEVAKAIVPLCLPSCTENRQGLRFPRREVSNRRPAATGRGSQSIADYTVRETSEIA